MELVTLSLTLLPEERASGEEGERDGGCTPRGDWEVMVGGRPTWMPLWASEDLQGFAVHGETVL